VLVALGQQTLIIPDQQDQIQHLALLLPLHWAVAAVVLVWGHIAGQTVGRAAVRGIQVHLV
jgi:hypothetical protein